MASVNETVPWCGDDCGACEREEVEDNLLHPQKTPVVVARVDCLATKAVLDDAVHDNFMAEGALSSELTVHIAVHAEQGADGDTEAACGSTDVVRCHRGWGQR